MALDTTISLTTLAEVITWLGGVPQVDGIWIYSDGTGATAATVEVTDATIVLTITGGAEAGVNTLTFADAANDTIAELIGVINALAGWKSGALTNGAANSTDLVVTGALACNTADNEQTLQIDNNYLLTELINRASDLINRYCNRILKSTTYTNEQYYGSGARQLILEQYPVTRASRVQSSRANSFSVLNTSTDANFITIEVTATTIRLVVDGGVNDDDTALTLSTYTSIDDLITAINALGKGWAITTLATDTATRDASELLPLPALFVTTAVAALIETGDTSLTDYQLIHPTEARNWASLLRPSVWLPHTEYHINYTAGFTTIPAALEMAVLEVIKFKLDSLETSGNLKSERIGNIYEYEKFNLADLKNILPVHLIAELDLFRARELF